MTSRVLEHIIYIAKRHYFPTMNACNVIPLSTNFSVLFLHQVAPSPEDYQILYIVSKFPLNQVLQLQETQTVTTPGNRNNSWFFLSHEAVALMNCYNDKRNLIKVVVNLWGTFSKLPFFKPLQLSRIHWHNSSSLHNIDGCSWQPYWRDGWMSNRCKSTIVKYSLEIKAAQSLWISKELSLWISNRLWRFLHA